MTIKQFIDGMHGATFDWSVATRHTYETYCSADVTSADSADTLASFVTDYGDAQIVAIEADGLLGGEVIAFAE